MKTAKDFALDKNKIDTYGKKDQNIINHIVGAANEIIILPLWKYM